MDHPLPAPSRKLLIASYWYPPVIGAAPERIHSFARYLPVHGWSVRVLTAGEDDPAVKDPGVEVHRVHDPFARSMALFSDYDPRAAGASWKDFFRDLVFPDRFLEWQRRARSVGIEIIQSQGIDAILTSFPPASSVLLALRLHQATDKPLILDFRDRWMGPGGYEPRRDRAKQSHQRLEREAVAAAALIVCVSDAMRDAVIEEHGVEASRVITITNGYEPSAPVAASTVSLKPLIISHVGAVISRNRPDLYLGSIATLAKSGQLPDVRFRFVGNLSKEYLRDTGLDSIVETTGSISREAAQREMSVAGALLLPVGSYGARWGHSAKIFEYLRSGRPILCLEEIPNSNDRRLLEEFAANRSYFAPMDQPELIAAQIEAMRADLVRTTPMPVMPAGLERFSRESLTAVLAQNLDRVLEGRSA